MYMLLVAIWYMNIIFRVVICYDYHASVLKYDIHAYQGLNRVIITDLDSNPGKWVTERMCMHDPV